MKRDFHNEVRVIYRALRRIYGKEKTQDEALRIFKIVYPEILRLKNSENERETLSEHIRYDIQKVTKSWHPQKKLLSIIERADNMIALPFDHDREELITYLEDITPVAMRIRKLTPRECFRLMDVDEEDIDKIQAYPFKTIKEREEYIANEPDSPEKRKFLSQSISKSSQYRLAGNSICCGVLYHIFRKAFIETGYDKSNKGEPIQLTLF